MALALEPRASQILKHGKQHGEDILTKEISSGNRTTLYVAVAPEGTATSAASWEVVRRVEDIDSNGDTVTIFDSRVDIAWDNYDDPTADGKAAWRADWW